MPDPTPVKLLAFIKETFDWDELKTLCFQLYVPFDDLAGQTREAKARELISYMQRVGRLPDLTAALARERPQQYRASFGSPPRPPAKPEPSVRNPRQVFISHAHQNADFAHRLADDLRREGYEIWIAPDSILPGEHWVEAMNRALLQSGIFLLVSTPHAVVSEWVQDETNYAIELATKRQIRFIRLDVRDADAPPLWTVRQHVSFRQDYQSSLNQLLSALETTAAPAHPVRDATVIAPVSSSVSTPTPIIQPKREPAEATPVAVNKVRPPTPTPPAEARAKRLPIWGWVVGALALLVLSVWAFNTFSGGGNGGDLENATPHATEVAGVRDEATPEPSVTQALTATTQLLATPTATATQTPTATITPSATPTPEPQVGDVRTVMRGGGAVEQVFVPAGSFMMGSENGADDERPVHKVTLNAFWIDWTEVTNAQYEACVAAGTCQLPAGPSSYTRGSYYGNPAYADYPVIRVSWQDARDFAEWAGGRLPTEAEWEYAARGPNTLIYPWGNEAPSCELLNFKNCIGDTAEVGSYADGASWVGALDMTGNVWEWVNDWYGGYGEWPAVNPTGPDLGEYRVLRGGAWNLNDRLTRAAFRGFDNPDYGDINVGFRVVEPLSEPGS